jgi:type IV pilus biogenesis protein PilP
MSARKSRQLPLALSAAAVLCACAVAFSAVAQQPAPAAPVAGAAPAAPPAAAAMAVPLPSSPMSAATAAEIQKINESMTLLQAELNRLELQAKIAAKRKEISGAAASATPAAEPTQSSFDRKAGNPSVVSVSGLKGNFEAALVFPGGVTQRVREGDRIDDRRVARVALNEVVLTDLKGHNVQRLAFGATPLTRERTPLPNASALPSGPMGFAPPPPPMQPPMQQGAAR